MNKQDHGHSPLSAYIEYQADWREAKAEEYPDDERNAQSAQALRSLVEYLMCEDAALNRNVNFLNELNAGTESVALGEEGRYRVSRYGFGYPATSVAQHEAFLEELSVVAMQDIYGEASERGDDWSGQLFTAELEAARREVHLPQRYWDMRSHMSEPELEEAIAAYSSDSTGE